MPVQLLLGVLCSRRSPPVLVESNVAVAMPPPKKNPPRQARKRRSSTFDREQVQVPQTPSRLHLNPPSRPPSTAPAGTPRLKLKPPATPQRKPLEQATPPKEKRRSKKGRYTEEHPAYFSRDAILAIAGWSSPPPSLLYGLFTSQTEPDEELSLGEYLARPVAPIVLPYLTQ